MKGRKGERGVKKHAGNPATSLTVHGKSVLFPAYFKGPFFLHVGLSNIIGNVIFLSGEFLIVRYQHSDPVCL